MNRNDFHVLSRMRLDEANVLFKAGHFEGAYYLAGYAVECALKACIARKTRQHDFPDKELVAKSYTHDLGKLVEAAGLTDALKRDRANDPGLDSHWEIVRGWSEQSRYRLFLREVDRTDATIQGVEYGILGGFEAGVLISAVDSEEGGVLQWIRQHW